MKTYRFLLVAFVTLVLQASFPSFGVAAHRSVIIKFHQRPGPAERALLHRFGGRVRRSYRLFSAVATSVPEAALDQLSQDPRVAYVEADGIVSAAEPLAGDEYDNSWGVDRIGSSAAHALGVTGAGVSVAVLDTGIDYTHEDLADIYKGGYDFVFDDADPFDDSFNSHGTHVAGIIAASRDGSGTVGVAPDAELYAVKVLDGAGFGLISWIINGIEWAIDNGVDVVNLSVSTPMHFQALQDACDAAYAAGVVVVAAAGNTYGGEVTYPAKYDSVIAATATDIDDLLASLAPAGPEVELAAPGVDVLSTVAGGHSALEGTSTAAPHIAGTAALILSAGIEDSDGDGFVADEVRQVLQATALDLGPEGPDEGYGYGLVDAETAVQSVLETSPRHFTVTRTRGSLYDDVVEIPLSLGSAYRISFENHGLRSVRIRLSDDQGRFMRPPLRRFRDRPGHRGFYLDATDTTLTLILYPRGRVGASAVIAVEEVDERAAVAAEGRKEQDVSSQWLRLLLAGLVRRAGSVDSGASSLGR